MSDLAHLTPLKKCSNCFRELPLNCYRPCKGGRDGLRSRCRECDRTAERERGSRAKRIEGKQIAPPAEKACTICHVLKPITDFPRDRQYKCGYNARCKDCKKTYRNRPDQKQKEAAACANWYHENREKKIAYAGTRGEYKRKWQKENPDKVRQSYQRQRAKDPEKMRAQKKAARNAHRARKRAANGKFTSREWKQLCEDYKNRCLCCGSDSLLTADHVIPLSKGGGNGIDNIQPLCLSCNSSKGTKNTDYRVQPS